MSAYVWTLQWAREANVRTFAKLETGSTNADAKEQISALGHRSVVVAEHQTAGRGRGEHTWSDERGQALLSSWVFQTEKNPQPIFSALIGLALYSAARATWPGISWALHAPNDLHVAKRGGAPEKIAGLLIEIVSVGNLTNVIIGLGLNATGAPSGTTPFAATSLRTELSLLKENCNESEWRRFLELWIEGCEAALSSGAVSELKQSSRSELLAALAAHPEFRDIKDVDADGSLVFTDGRRLPWSKL